MIHKLSTARLDLSAFPHWALQTNFNYIHKIGIFLQFPTSEDHINSFCHALLQRVINLRNGTGKKKVTVSCVSHDHITYTANQ